MLSGTLQTFQSTLPARGATVALLLPAVALGISIHAPRTGSDQPRRAMSSPPIISIHAPRTGSDGQNDRAAQHQHISIHAPRTGSDRVYVHWKFFCKVFQSTLPARGATRQRVRPAELHRISIHAPRTGSDASWPQSSPSKRYFNPRSPHGERPDGAAVLCALLSFQSTLPARGATA